MSMADASRLAPPDAIFLPTRHDTYGPYAKRVRAMLDRFSPAVQTASIDEFFIDFRGCDRLYRTAADPSADAAIERVVREMCAAVRAEVGLPASAGIGTSRLVAKVASGMAKPAGVRFVAADTEVATLSPLGVRKIPGIGPSTEARLLAADIRTVGDLLSLPPGPLRARFGGLSDRLYRTLQGASAPLGADRPAFLEHDPRGSYDGSLSNERTFFDDIANPAVLEAQLRALTERVCWRARQRDARARTVTLKLRYADFQTLSRSVTIEPTCDERVIGDVAAALLEKARTRPLPIRLLGVGLSHLVGPEPQLGLFAPKSRRPPGAAIDAVRERFGYEAIRVGRVAGSG
jgi:DNA polymerase-4